jgi:hypothetical protein
MEALPGPMPEARWDHGAAMPRGPIPADHQAARHRPQQMLQQGHDIGRVDRPCLAVNIPLALWGDGADRREMIPGPPLLECGSPAYGCLRADDPGQGKEPRFIDAEEALALGLGPRLSTGHLSSRQRVMAASSRWRARRAGFCRLQRIA